MRWLGSSSIVSLIESLHGLHSKTVTDGFEASRFTFCKVIRWEQFGHWSGRFSKGRPCALAAAIESDLFCSPNGTNDFGLLTGGRQPRLVEGNLQRQACGVVRNGLPHSALASAT